MEKTPGLTPLTIDVVVPTVSENQDYLNSIFQMEIPPGTNVTYYFVSDGPRTALAASDPGVNTPELVHVLKNKDNQGASASRNRGIDEGTSDYILFLDDDVEPDANLLQQYKESIEKDPDAPGFVGSSRFPLSINSFTRGIVASDILTFWDIAGTRQEVRWGITANLLVRRKSIGSVRFSTLFPKRGGGEDIDFCLRIVEKTGRSFRTAPNAIVHHPWWNNGSRQYRRFARWAYGDGRLPQLHKRYKYWNAPNMIETLAYGTPLMVVLAILGALSALKVFEWLGLVGIAEFGGEVVRLATRSKKSNLLASIEATLVRISNDIGRLAGNIKRRSLLGIGERFDYFTTRESIQYERKVAISKFLLFVGVTVLVLL